MTLVVPSRIHLLVYIETTISPSPFNSALLHIMKPEIFQREQARDIYRHILIQTTEYNLPCMFVTEMLRITIRWVKEALIFLNLL